MKKRTLSFLFVCISGASALIYEIVWQRYLAILLGAHARASSVVLAVFLGGMSIGYAYFGRLSLKGKFNLIRTYCLVEVLLAAWAVCFPVFFHFAFKSTGWLYQTFGINNLLIDLWISALLIGFPTILMGGTLPLLTQALSKNVEDASRLHSKLYGFNTLGACFGCLFAGYVLIPETSFEKALFVGAGLNLFTALYFYLNFKTAVSEAKIAPGSSKKEALTKNQKALVAVGFTSGLCLLTLETVLIRLMGLATGASNFNFTIIVAVFIFSLAVGSLAMKRVSKATIKTLLWNQVLCTLLLVLLYVSGDYWSYAVHVIRSGLKDVPQSFYLFQLLLAGATTLLLVLPIGMCGLTLPLCFHLLKDEEETLGFRVGQLYCWNTVGCVVGSLFGGYLLFNYLNLDQIFRVTVLAMVLTIAFSFYISMHQKRAFNHYFPGALGIASFLVVLFLPGYHTDRWIQPFRNQEQTEVTLKGAQAFGEFLSRSTRMAFWKDGPNTSMGIGATPKEGNEESRSIFVNGKSDGNTRGDFFTTLMLAHIPALLSNKIDKACVIGFGTGITVGTLALYSEVKQIDVLEIANTIVENAYQFDAYNGGVSKNPKVKFHEMDAFRFFEARKEPYDLIISEPSNPWVMGIENLYSEEFYRLARKQLSADGTFAQWIHTYSFNDDLFRMVIRTMRKEFPYLSVFQLKGGDFALVGRTTPFTEQAFGSLLRKMNQGPIKTTLQTASMMLPEVILALEIVPPMASEAMDAGGEIHRLTSPRLSNEAAKAFFMRTGATPHAARRSPKAWPAAISDSLLQKYLGGRPFSPQALAALRFSFCDNASSKNTFLCEESVFASHLQDSKFSRHSYPDVLSERVLASLGKAKFTETTRFKSENLTEVYNFFESYKKYISPIVYTDPKGMIQRLDGCMKTAPKSDELYGECLLQKLLVIDGLSVPNYDFDKLASDYLNWFSTIPNTHPQYQKLKEAGDILVRMMGKKAS